MSEKPHVMVMAEDVLYAERIKGVAVKPPTPQEVADLRFSSYVLGTDLLVLMWGDRVSASQQGRSPE